MDGTGLWVLSFFLKRLKRREGCKTFKERFMKVHVLSHSGMEIMEWTSLQKLTLKHKDVVLDLFDHNVFYISMCAGEQSRKS